MVDTFRRWISNSHQAKRVIVQPGGIPNSDVRDVIPLEMDDIGLCFC